ncbi:MAG: TlyA family RNA methyltransferase [Burkholderiales bacterium]|nr:TlyA family RNA methyltransferase [Burkholderiales bacterium]
MRADQLLLARGLAPSRSAAQRLIAAGALRWRRLPSLPWQTATKAGDNLPEVCEVDISDTAELRWVSRGGLKLEGALDACAIDVTGRQALDVGQSTGGFTEVLLARGAVHVVGVDVGHGQLHPRLQADARITALEGVNARHLNAETLGEACPADGFGFICGDLSFISLALVLPAIAPLLAEQGDLLALVKPQFELQPADISRGGLVKNDAAYARVETRMREACRIYGLKVLHWLDSAITGGDGNREFFLHARRVG